MRPVTEQELTLEVQALEGPLTVKVYPSGPVGFEFIDNDVGVVMLTRNAWTTVASHASVGDKGQSLHLENGAIGTDVTVVEDGVRIEQSGGIDAVTLPKSVVSEISEHIRETRFALQQRGYDAE